MDFVANFIRFPAMQKVRKSVKISQSYREYEGMKVGTFLRHSICIILITLYGQLSIKCKPRS